MGEQGGQERDFPVPEPPEGLLTASENRVLAQMDDPDALEAAIEQLVQSGLERDEIFVLCGAKGAEQLDASGRHHGLLGRVHRIAERIGGDEYEYLLQANDHLTAGGFMISVPADDTGKAGVARILGANGAHTMAHFGKGHWEPLGP